MQESDPLAPEETPNEAAAAPPAEPPKPVEPASVEAQMQTLRIAVLLLGAALLVSNVCFFLFAYKQNNLLIAQIDNQRRVLNQNEPLYEANKQKLGALLQELGAYAQTHREIVPLLVKYNFARVQSQPALAPSTVPGLPAK